MPAGSAPAALPAVTMTVQPATAATVAAIQRGPSFGPPLSRVSAPVNTGALPMATTAPMATPVIRTAARERGLVTSAELARRTDLAIGRLYRWFAVHTGVEPAVYLAAVRFSAFVREAIGQGPVRPQDVLATIRWYSRSNYPPREQERFTGLAPLELRRLERGIADVLGVPA